MTSKQDDHQDFWSSDRFRRLLACLMLGLTMGALWIPPFPGDIFRKQVRMMQDYFVARDNSLPPREDFVFIGIDANSMQPDGLAPEVIEAEPALQKMAQGWPWDRSVHAAMINRLADAGARLIILDVLFQAHASPEGDTALAEAISQHRDKIVLASAFMPTEKDGDLRLIEPIDAFLGPLGEETACGYVNFWPHAADGIVRNAHFTRKFSEVNNEEFHHPGQPVIPSLAAAAAEKLGATIPNTHKRIRLARIDGQNLEKVYSPLSYYSVLVPEDWKSQYENGAFFKGKIVLIGPASPIFHDSHDTPAGQIYGAQLHMHALTVLLENAWYQETQQAPMRYLAFLVSLGVFIAALLSVTVQRPWTLIGLLFLGLLTWAGLEYIMVSASHRMLGSMATAWSFGWGMLGAVLWQAIADRARKQQLHRQLRRSMSPDVADAIVRAPEGYYMSAEGNRRLVTVLFTDIRGFTDRSEQQDAGELVSQLNSYLERMVDVIFSHGGTVDKFIGDAIMASWGSLGSTDSAQQAQQATLAAQEMLKELTKLNAEWKKDGRAPFHIGIGIHQGEAIVGEIGSDQRTDFTVIGDAVNLASRIEGLTKTFGTELIVSDAIAQALPDTDQWISIAKVRVKGRNSGVGLWIPSCDDHEANHMLRRLAQLYRDGDCDAARDILTVPASKMSPHVGVTDFFRKELENTKKPPADWDGLLVMKSK